MAPQPTFWARQTKAGVGGVWDCETCLRIGADELAISEVGRAERGTSRASLHFPQRSHLISPPLIERLKHTDSPSPGADKAIGHPDRPSLGPQPPSAHGEWQACLPPRWYSWNSWNWLSPSHHTVCTVIPFQAKPRRTPCLTMEEPENCLRTKQGDKNDWPRR